MVTQQITMKKYFLVLVNKSIIESSYLIEKQFLLGTDKYGRDLLSRLPVGSRI